MLHTTCPKGNKGNIENALETKVLSFLIDCNQNVLTLYNVLKLRQKLNDKIMGFENHETNSNLDFNCEPELSATEHLDELAKVVTWFDVRSASRGKDLQRQWDVS